MNNSPNAESPLEKFVEKLDFTNLEGKPEDFYKAGLAFVENGQFDDGIVEFVKVIKTISNQDTLFLESEKELKSMGFSSADIRAAIRMPISKKDFNAIKNEKGFEGEQDIDMVKSQNMEQKIYGVVKWINLFILLTAGLCSAAIGVIGTATGDEGGRQSSIPFFLFPIIFLFVFLVSKVLHKMGETRYALILDILSIIFVIFLVVTNFN
jgi:hypothetical protein